MSLIVMLVVMACTAPVILENSAEIKKEQVRPEQGVR
jgi:hypothetical protein